MDQFIPTESVAYWKPSSLEGVELMQATYVTRCFPRHVHDGFAVGVIEAGALGFFYRHANVVAPAGAINLANPDEVHTGQAAADSGWRYRMFYFSADRLRQAAAQMAGKSTLIPFFPMGVIHDRALAAEIGALHRAITDEGCGRLESQSRFLELLVRMIRRYADAPPRLTPAARHPGIVRARDYMQARFGENLRLNELATVAGLSPFHFTRLFKSVYGLAAHAYLTQVRVLRAKRMIATGTPIAETALATGFADQSHLTRLFNRFVGLSPGRYRKIVQDS